jgi:hypothetical protein
VNLQVVVLVLNPHLLRVRASTTQSQLVLVVLHQVATVAATQSSQLSLQLVVVMVLAMTEVTMHLLLVVLVALVTELLVM